MPLARSIVRSRRSRPALTIFLTKPLDMDHLTLCVERLLAHRKLQDEVRRFRQALKPGDYHGMVGNSPSMRGCSADWPDRRADGPGPDQRRVRDCKGLVARALHAEIGPLGQGVSGGSTVPASRRICWRVNSSAIAAGAFSGADKERPGLFREADGGTAGSRRNRRNAGLVAGPSWLRALQDGAIRAGRVLIASSRSMCAVVAADQCSTCLPGSRPAICATIVYYRLETSRWVVPPLFVIGGEDIRPARNAVHRSSSPLPASAGARNDSRSTGRHPRLPWPGNVRELRNIMERAVTFCNGEEIAPRAPAGPESQYNQAAAGILVVN